MIFLELLGLLKYIFEALEVFLKLPKCFLKFSMCFEIFRVFKVSYFWKFWSLQKFRSLSFWKKWLYNKRKVRDEWIESLD